MGEFSSIEWTTHTFNPWIGCAKVSAGCTHCYAETLMDTRYGRVEWGVNGTRVRTSDANWRKPHAWNRAAEKAGRRDRVFCASLADAFEDRPELVPWRADLLTLIEQTPHLDWLLLTKRPENVLRLFCEALTYALGVQSSTAASDWLAAHPNVWIGTSVEDQAAAEERIPHLLRIPAAVRFLSMEPLLGRIDLSYLDTGDDGPMWDCLYPCEDHSSIDWVIVGGESGHGARPMHPEWVRSIRDQCLGADVSFFFKQWGEWWPGENGRLYRGETIHYTDGQPMVRMGKKEAGRMLDGREWSEFPLTAAATSEEEGE